MTFSIVVTGHLPDEEDPQIETETLEAALKVFLDDLRARGYVTSYVAIDGHAQNDL